MKVILNLHVGVLYSSYLLDLFLNPISYFSRCTLIQMLACTLSPKKGFLPKSDLCDQVSFMCTLCINVRVCVCFDFMNITKVLRSIQNHMLIYF